MGGEGGLTVLAIFSVRLNVGTWPPLQAGPLPFIGIQWLDQWHLPVTFEGEKAKQRGQL